jgi:hypothetical protein
MLLAFCLAFLDRRMLPYPVLVQCDGFTIAAQVVVKEFG